MKPNERVVLIEYSDGHPFNVVVRGRGIDRETGVPYEHEYDNYHDVEYSRKYDTCYAYNSGGGPVQNPLNVNGRCQYWVEPGLAVVTNTKWLPKLNRYDVVPADPSLRLDAPLPPTTDPQKVLDDCCEETKCVYCSRCKDWFPGDGYSRFLCDHCFECDRCDEFHTPDEPCRCRYERRQARKRAKLGIVRVKLTFDEYKAKGEELFGTPDPLKWVWVCMGCKKPALGRLWGRVGRKAACGQSCPGQGMKERGRQRSGWCLYHCSHGLNPVVIVNGVTRKPTGTTYLPFAVPGEGGEVWPARKPVVWKLVGGKGKAVRS